MFVVIVITLVSDKRPTVFVNCIAYVLCHVSTLASNKRLSKHVFNIHAIQTFIKDREMVWWREGVCTYRYPVVTKMTPAPR